MRLDFNTAVDGSAAVRSLLLRRKAAHERQHLEDEQLKERREKAETETEKGQDILQAAILSELSASEIEALGDRLDLHQQAVIEALQTNANRLADAEQDLREIRGEAYQLEDGRRVYKTEDGTRVFDESGEEISAAEVDKGVIEDLRPSWEKYSGAVDNLDTLEATQQELLDYQARLDKAQELIASGDLTEDSFAEIDALLAGDDAPSTVREQLQAKDPTVKPAPSDATLEAPLAGTTGPEVIPGLQ